MIRNILIVLMASLVLTSCSSIPRVLDFNSKPVEREKLVLPSVDKFKSRDVQWIVLTPENAEKVFKELESSGQDIVLFALKGDDWESLTLNLADIMKLVQQQKSIIAAYKNYYEDEE